MYIGFWVYPKATFQRFAEEKQILIKDIFGNTSSNVQRLSRKGVHASAWKWGESLKKDCDIVLSA